MEIKLGFIGAGNMGSALVGGLIKSKVLQGEQILVSDVERSRVQMLVKNFGVQAMESNSKLVEGSDVLVLAVKPQIIDSVLSSLRDLIRKDQTVISIAAGVSIQKLERLLPPGVPVVRVLPNLPSLVGCGVTVISMGSSAGPREKKIAQKIMKGVGIVLHAPEKDLDAVTAISGSGPAYVFLILEALTDAGVRVGLSRDFSGQLALSTLIGSGKMVSATNRSPEELRAAVSSPGGTTITGLHILEQAGVRAAFMDAVVAACNRSKELGREE